MSTDQGEDAQDDVGGEDAEPQLDTTVFNLVNRVLHVPQACFYKPDNLDEPVFVVDLGDMQGELRLKSLKKTFGIAHGSHDDKLLSVVFEALKYVEDVRPGDRIPNEILDGSASWTVSPRHKLIAKNRLEAQLITWLSGTKTNITTPEEFEKFLSLKENKEQLRLAFRKAARELGFESSNTTAVLLKLELLARELCYVEALREAFESVPAIAKRLKEVAEHFSGDPRVKDTIVRVRSLMRKGITEYTDIFAELDGKTSEIISMLKDLDKQIEVIREGRDRLRFLQMKWTPLVNAWSELVINQGGRVQDLMARTYRFLATRLDTTNSLIKGRKEKEEIERQARLAQQKEAEEAAVAKAKAEFRKK